MNEPTTGLPLVSTLTATNAPAGYGTPAEGVFAGYVVGVVPFTVYESIELLVTPIRNSFCTGDAARVAMNASRLLARLAWFGFIDPESSMTKRMSVCTD